MGSSGPAPAASAGPAKATTAAPKVEAKKEEKPEDDDVDLDGAFDLFGE